MQSLTYDDLIDAETWAFIARTGTFYPPETASMGIDDQRRIYDSMCRAFQQPYPDGITAQDAPVAGVPCRIYAGAEPSVLYLHGGGFVVGGLHSHDDICAEICARTGLRVVAADYRLSPENLHPAAFDDALAVAKEMAAHGPVLLVGDSAGATLAAACCHALRGSGLQILGQILIYPGLGGDENSGSYLRHAHAPMLTRDDVVFYKNIRHSTPPPYGDATVAPLQDRSFAGLPPTLAIAAQCDPLADDARHYAAAVLAAGGRAHFVEEEGLVHGYLRARHTVARAAQSFTRVCNTLSALAISEWPFGDTSK